MPGAIDLNADAGEGAPHDEGLFAAGITSVNAACGAHAGDVHTLVATARLAARHGVAFGAHPGYADREGFGRRAMAVAGRELAELVTWQVAAALAAAKVAGVGLAHVKPHGALYHRLAGDAEAARLFVESVRSVRPTALFFGPPGGALFAAVRAAGGDYVPEGFIDRGYGTDGVLVPRGRPGALLVNKTAVRRQALHLAAVGNIRTLCVHGDGHKAVLWLKTARTALVDAGHRVEAPAWA